MGTPKALLPVGGVPLVTHSLARLRAAGVGRIAVVLGADAARVRRTAAPDLALVVLNDAPERGPFSSLVLGLRVLCGERGEFPAAFVLPVDVPCPAPDVFAALATSAERPGTLAAVPVVGDRGGHPVLLTAAGADRVLREPGALAESRLDVLLRRWGSAVRRVPVRDRGVLLNLNDPDAAAAFARRGAYDRSRASSRNWRSVRAATSRR